MIKKRKVVIVGAGNVGASTAFCMINQGICDEIVLIDMNTERAKGETLDMIHSIAFMNRNMQIKLGDYTDCKDADVLVITASAPMGKENDRLVALKSSSKIVTSIVSSAMENGFNGFIVVVSNPVDIMTYVAWKESGLPKNHVIGSGTVLDTARLRHALSEKLGFADSNIHAYIMGEHGDSSFVPWIHSYIGCKNLLEYLDENNISLSELQEIYIDVRDKAYKIIELKRATYYGIGLALKRIVSCILNNERAILPVSAYQNGEYGKEGYFIGTPSVVGSNGVEQVIRLHLNENDQQRFDHSFDTLKQTIEDNLQDIL